MLVFGTFFGQSRLIYRILNVHISGPVSEEVAERVF